jgi:hypothetical protein
MKDVLVKKREKWLDGEGKDHQKLDGNFFLWLLARGSNPF